MTHSNLNDFNKPSEGFIVWNEYALVEDIRDQKSGETKGSERSY